MIPHDVKDDHYIVEGAHGTIAEQTDEAYYDDRSDASDDIEKGRLSFPRNIYGRERELKALCSVYDELASATDRDGIEGNISAIGEEEKVEEESSPQLDSSASSVLYDGSRVVFLSGYSGIGKSALVNEFTKRIQSKNPPSPIIYSSGKYTEQSTASAPFSAITEMLEKLSTDLSKRVENERTLNQDLCSKVKSKIQKSELIGLGTEGNRVLRAIFSKLSPLLGNPDDTYRRRNLADGSNSGANNSMNAIKDCTHELLSVICQTLDHPMILFLDDLQWADGPSFEMLSFLLSSTKLRKIMYICAYRSNEVDAYHAFAKLIKGVTKLRSGDELRTPPKSVETMDLFSLSPEAIKKFIADSVKKEDAEEVTELAEAVYTKTMGNIFFVKQAMEELVRKNILFYDLMCFEWRWVVSKVDLANYMSDDVVETVKGKIEELSADIQNLLVVMAYIPNSLDVSMLKALMNHRGTSFDEHTMSNLLKETSNEGMLMFSKESKSYVFAHDRIRQASLEFAAKKDQEDELLLHISQVMLNVAGQGPDMEWCLYVAVDIYNVLPPVKTNSGDLIKLNLRVSKIAGSRGSLGRENELLHKALNSLESSGTMWRDYGLTLELCNAVIASDYSLGSYDTAEAAIDEVLQNGKSLDDKLQAYLHRMLCKCARTPDYEKGAEEGRKLLNLYGFAIPATISKTYMVKEGMKLKLAMKNRQYSCLTRLSVKEDPIFYLFQEAQRYASFTANEKLTTILTWKAIQCAIKRGMSRHLPFLMVNYAMSLAKQSKVKMAQEMGQVSLALSEKVPDDVEICATIHAMAYGCVLPQLQSFRSSVEPLFQCHKDLKLVGGLDHPTLGSMLAYFQAYFAAGLELGPLLESKLVLMEEYCRTIDRLGFLTTFQISRQFALNLRTRTKNPTEFCGEAFHEDETLKNMNANARKMTLRDSFASRLQLAFVFWDEECMANILEALCDYPLTDVSVARLHNRLCFTGLAAFALCQRKAYESYSKLGRDCLAYFAHLIKHGSVNAKPVYIFMLAMKAPSRENFKKAIDACAEASMIHLEAMAKERYAALLKEENDESLANDYITSSYWLYQDWGAHAKALKLSKQHGFLKHSTRKKADSLSLATDITVRSRRLS